MSLSPEVQAAVDEIRRTKNIQRAQAASIKLMGEKIADLNAKVAAIPVKQELSAEDKEALQREVQELDALNDELEAAVPANTPGAMTVSDQAQPGAGSSEADKPRQMTPEEDAEARGEAKNAGPREMPGSDAQHSANGPSNAPAAENAPLMPTSAFNPAGTGGSAAPAGDGQPAQPAAIETAGGFVIAGGGATQRAPGSRPESPSSSLVVPEDPDAKAPASTADLVKSGVGDSRGNENIGSDLRPVSEGPGIVKEPTEDQARREQERQDELRAEEERRRANPLNLSEEDLAKRNEAAKASERDVEDARQGKPPADDRPPVS